MKKDNKNLKVWLINVFTIALVLYLSSWLYPKDVVLGNNLISVPLAVIFNALILTALLASIKPVLFKLKLKKMTDWYWALSYAVTNIVAIWILARFAVSTGFGISSFTVAISLGLVLTIIQYFLWKWQEGKMKR